MKNNFRVTILILGLILSALLVPSQSFAKTKASIQDLDVRIEDGIVIIGFVIDNCFSPKMEEAVLSGVPTTFHIRILVQNRRWLFLRSNVLDVTLERTIKYERLKREFRVILPETTELVHTTTSFFEAKEWMSRVEDLALIPTWRLDENREYTLRVKAELSKVNLPLFFRYIFFFVSLWDFETDWHNTPLILEGSGP